MKCQVCGAPALPRGGACVFCRSPLADGRAPADLLDYLAERIPGAVARRGLFGWGPVRDLAVEVGGERFRARFKRGRFRLQPPAGEGEWVEMLIQRLAVEAAGNADLRGVLSRAGWALHPPRVRGG